MDLQVELYDKIKVSDLKLETLSDLVKGAAAINETNAHTNARTTIIRNHLWTLMVIINYAQELKNGKKEFIPLSILESNIKVDFNILDESFSAQNYVDFLLSIEISEDLNHIVASCRVIFTYAGIDGKAYNKILNEFLESINFESSILKQYFMVDYITYAQDMYNRVNEAITLANAELSIHTEDNSDFDLATTILHTYRDSRISTGLIAAYSNYFLNFLTHNCKNSQQLLNLNVSWGINKEVKFNDDLDYITIFNPGIKFFKSNLSKLCISDDLARALMNTEILFNKMSKFTDAETAFNIPVDIKVIVECMRKNNVDEESIAKRIEKISAEKYTNVDMFIGDVKHFVEMFKLMKKEFFAELLKVVLLFIAEFETLEGKK